MPAVDSITFTTPDTGDDAYAFIRVEGTRVGLTLSLRSDGDLEVFFGPAELDWLIRTLHEAQRQLHDPRFPPHE
jgi:hypothetical protein